MQEDPTISSDYIAIGSDIRELFFLFEKAPFAMSVLKGPSLTIEIVNEKLLEIWGKKKEEVIGKPLLKCFPELIGTDTEKIFKTAYETGEKFVSKEYETSFVRNGELYHAFFDLNIDPIQINGSVTGLLVTSTEVTEQVLTRKKIEESKNQLQLITDSLPALVSYINKDEQYQFNNKSYEQWFGHEKEIIKGKTIKEVVGDKVYRSIEPYIKRVLSGETVSYEAWAPYKEGGERYISATYIPHFNEENKVSGFYALVNDLTERKKAEEVVKASEDNTKLIMNSALDAIISIDAEGKFTEWTPQAEKIFGWNKEEMLGKKLIDTIIPEQYRKRHAQGMKHYLQTGEGPILNKIIEITALNRKGIEFPVELSIVPMKQSGSIFFCAFLRDITERKKNEIALKESEEKNRLFIEYAPAAMAMFDKEMRYVAVSKQWMEEYDLEDDVIGKMHYELFPNILQRWKNVHARCLKGAIERSDEDFYIKDDGTPVWLKWEVHPWHKASDEIGGIVIFTENITERKKAGQLIKESEEQLRYNFQTAPISIWLEDFSAVKRGVDELIKNGIKDFDVYFSNHKDKLLSLIDSVVIKDVNAATLNLYEGNKEELLSSLNNFFVEDTQQAFINEIKIIAEGGGRFETETIVRNSKGEKLNVYCRIDFPYNDDYSNVQVIILNITEQKKAEKALKESEERFRMLATEAPLFVWLTNENLQTTYLNKAGLEYFDVDESVSFSTLSWKKFIHPVDLPRVLDTMHENAKKHEPYTLEMRLKNGRTGEYRWFLDKGQPRYENDRFVGFIGTSLDIHEKREMEELEHKRQKKELEKALESDKLKTDFIKMASHELKTPVTSIKGFVQLLLTMIKESGEKELPPLMVKSSLVSIERQVNRLTRLMSELLDLSKLESGQFELNLEEHSLNELMIDIVQDILYTGPKQHINLYHEFECKISSDKDRLSQAVMNLLMNAIKYSPNADKVDVTISKNSQNMAAISIQDYGIGIDKKDHEKIFERFYRVEGKTELTYQGFGIGLYIAREIIHMHGGTIEVKSEKGKGSTFTFTIPIKE